MLGPGVCRQTKGAYASIAVVAFAVFASAGTIAQQKAEPAALVQFNVSIQRHVELHRQIELQLPPFRAHSDAQDIFESSNAMASALQTARADALIANGSQAGKMVADTLEEADGQAPLPVVNGRFPWRVLVDTHADLIADILRNIVR